MKEENTKKTVIKGIVFGIVFLLSLIVISIAVNHDNNDLTVEMSEAKFPLVYMQKDGNVYNCMHGYSKAMETAFERDNITVLDEQRGTDVIVEIFQDEIASAGFEVRSIDGQRLIETGEMDELTQEQNKKYFHLELKDLIEKNQEYCLVIVITMPDGTEVRYYTRAVWSKESHLEENFKFVQDFHKKTFFKNEGKALARYMEPNSEGDNSSFYRVNIHSSIAQLTWGNIQPNKISEPVPGLRDLTKDTANISQVYYIATGAGKNIRYFQVEENYRVRYTPQRMYLLDFDRKMEQLFNTTQTHLVENCLNLGVVNPDLTFTESEDGNIIVFENAGRLFSYNVTDSKLSVLFSFYDKKNYDDRDLFQKHHFKVLNVDEAGNIYFSVYGYMNRGRHEGDVGIQIYYYNGTLNTVEEIVYMPYERSEDILSEQLQKFIYMNRNNQLFIMLDGGIYQVDLKEKNYSLLINNMNEDAIYISDSGERAVWEKGDDLYNCSELVMLNFSTESKSQIRSDAGECILPLGFIENDIVYGLAKKTDIFKNSVGQTVFPMYAVYIQNAGGEILKEYRQENIYVTGSKVQENQVILHRLKKTEEDSFTELPDDQIVSSAAIKDHKNEKNVVNSEMFKKQIQIVLKERVEEKEIKILTPKEVLYEGGRELDIQLENSEVLRFYVYDLYGLKEICMNEAHAVKSAYKASGNVINEHGSYVFRKETRLSRNQIMAIKQKEIEEGQSALSVCLNEMLNLEGIVRNTQLQIAQGESALEILQKSMPEYEILELTGCPLEAVLYYLNYDFPVLVMMKDKNPVLITGFNETQIVIMDPEKSALYKESIKDAGQYFEQNGNVFLTYISNN